jgi:hypothetical protein
MGYRTCKNPLCLVWNRTRPQNKAWTHVWDTPAFARNSWGKLWTSVRLISIRSGSEQGTFRTKSHNITFRKNDLLRTGWSGLDSWPCTGISHSHFCVRNYSGVRSTCPMFIESLRRPGHEANAFFHLVQALSAIFTLPACLRDLLLRQRDNFALNRLACMCCSLEMGRCCTLDRLHVSSLKEVSDCRSGPLLKVVGVISFLFVMVQYTIDRIYEFSQSVSVRTANVCRP